jgi:two-component system nitrate/nitrite response regulator NarL
VNFVLCDDHRMFVEALALVLECEGWQVVARTSSVADAAAAVAREHVDICILDVGLPDGSGLDGIEQLVAASPQTKIVMLSALADRDTVAAALAAGARGFARKTCDLKIILDVLTRVAAGQLAIEGADGDASDHGGHHQHRRLADFLTAREEEVLQCLVAGYNTRALAVEMGISYATARSHVQNVLTKLGVHSQLQAVAYAGSPGRSKRKGAPGAIARRNVRTRDGDHPYRRAAGA